MKVIEEIAIGMGSSAVVAILAVFVGQLRRRPKLTDVGSSGLGGDEYRTWALDIGNAPSYLGIHLGQTIIFGFLIHGFHNWSFTTQRKPAVDCQATIQEKVKGSAPVRLYFEGGDPATGAITIVDENQGQARLPLFVTFADEPSTYRVLEPESGPLGRTGPRPSKTGRPITQTARFLVVVECATAANFKMSITMRVALNGELELVRPGRKRWQHMA